LALAAPASSFPDPVFLTHTATNPAEPKEGQSPKKDLITRRQLAKMLCIQRRVVTASESDQRTGFSLQKVRLHET